MACNHSHPVKSLNRTRVAVRTMRRDTAESGMESPTACQANRTRVAVKTMRRVTAESGMKSPTSCQANRIRVAVMTVRRDSWTWHGTTHFLLSQQDQSGSEDSEKGHS